MNLSNPAGKIWLEREVDLTAGKFLQTDKHLHRKNKKKRSGNIFRAVTLERQQLLDAVAVVSLQFNGIALNRAATGKFSFHIFRKIFKIDISWIKSLDNGHFFPVPAFVHFDIDPLLFLCYLLTDT
jgi:hypothetical protein